jgi:hypothetical protein
MFDPRAERKARRKLYACSKAKLELPQIKKSALPLWFPSIERAMIYSKLIKAIVHLIVDT